MKQINEQLTKAQKASRDYALLDGEKRNAVLRDLADHIGTHAQNILQANEKDLGRMDSDDPKYDRLKLSQERLDGIAGDMRNVVSLDSPVGTVLEERDLKSGLHLKKVSVPLGVIGVIYEARPNVTFDVFALCFKAGNACVLKGGSDASDSNNAALKVIHEVLTKHGITTDGILLLESREEAQALMDAVGAVDVIIPRGSQGLIDHVRSHSKVPVIETGAGVVHTYVDASADAVMAAKIVGNAKTRRVSVCNALDALVIHEKLLSDLSAILKQCADENVVVHADEESYNVLNGKYPEELLKKANAKHFGTEFLDYEMAVKTVANAQEAIDHIAEYSSKHSEAIVASDEAVIDLFVKSVDAASVFVNTSTAYADGAEFGLGAEIGISTQKLHARGPFALRELTSYTWVVRGDGQVRG